jgi:hypothetical protein
MDRGSRSRLLVDKILRYSWLRSQASLKRFYSRHRDQLRLDELLVDAGFD